MSARTEATAPVRGGRGPAKYVTWFDFILVASIAVGSFSAGSFVPKQIPLVAVEPVPRIEDFETRSGVLDHRGELAVLAARQAKVRDAIGSEHVSILRLSATRPQSAETTEAIMKGRDLLTLLEQEEEALVAQQEAVSKSLARSSADAAKQRERAAREHARTLSLRHIVGAYAVLAVALLAVSAVARLRKLRIAAAAVSLGSALLLSLLLVGRFATWSAALVLLALVLGTAAFWKEPPREDQSN